MKSGSLIPPLPAPDYYTILGAFALMIGLIVVAFPYLVRLWRWIRKPGEANRPVPRALAKLYGEKIDSLESQWRGNELSTRDFAQRLSQLVRNFCAEAWNVDTTHLTLRELKQRRMAPAARAIELLYEAEFAQEADLPNRALASVKGLVRN